MDIVSELHKLLYGSLDQPNFLTLLVNFVACVIMSFVVRSFYVKFLTSSNEKMDISSIIPILSSVIFLVIIVVKSSVALSLGLLGAFSMVRFRTPIKEPTKLIYLVIAIVIGLGYGANFTIITTVIVAVILLINYYLIIDKKIENTFKFLLVIKCSNVSISHEEILKDIAQVCPNAELVRFNSVDQSSTMEFEIKSNKKMLLEELVQEFQKRISKDQTISFSLKAL